MEWKDVAGVVGKAAPLLGSILGSVVPGVGTAAGGAVGAMIASVLGSENTPDAIHAAIAADPQAAIKLAQIEADNRTQLAQIASAQAIATIQAETAQIQSVNQTMQAEGKSEHWPQWSWRPYIGFCTGTAFLVLTVLVSMLAWQAVSGKDAAALAMIPQLVSAFAVLFSVPGAILGVASWHRGKTKRIAAGEAPEPGMVDKAIGAIRGK